MDSCKLSTILPNTRKFRILECGGSEQDFEAKFRLDVNSEDDIKSWLFSDFSKVMNCNFILRSSGTKRKGTKLYRLYWCSLSSFKKSNLSMKSISTTDILWLPLRLNTRNRSIQPTVRTRGRAPLQKSRNLASAITANRPNAKSHN
jgi:hypothetical protein